MKRLLILSYHFAPSAAVATHRILGFTRYLPEYGWQCTVVSAPSLPWEPRDEALLDQLHPATTLRYVPYPRSVWRLIAPTQCWLPAAGRAARHAVRELRPNVVLSSGPPHCIHLLGLSLKRRFGLPLVADFRDPWITLPWATDASSARRGLVHHWEAAQERRLFRRADMIISNTPNAAAALHGVFPEQRYRITSITNGFDPESFAKPLCPKPTSADTPVTILHPGQIYAGRDPRPLFRAIAKYNAESRRAPAIRLRLVGNHAAVVPSFDLQGAIREAGLDGFVSIEPPIPYSHAIEAMRQSDQLLLLDTPGRLLGVPAKLYEYLGAGRPILALTESGSDAEAILASGNTTFRRASPSNPDEIFQALQDLTGIVTRERAQSRPLTTAPGDSPYTRRNMAGQLAQLLDSLVSDPEPSLRPSPRTAERPQLASRSSP